MPAPRPAAKIGSGIGGEGGEEEKKHLVAAILQFPQWNEVAQHPAYVDNPG